MSRFNRYNIIGHAQYILHTGHNSTSIFHNSEDYSYYLSKLQYASIKCQVKIHSYSLNNNNINILGTPYIISGVSKMMQIIGREYSRYYNKKYKKTGAVFDGRYKASLVDSGSYILQCYMYLEQWPYRLCTKISLNDQLWSSFHHNAHGKHDAIISEHNAYYSLGSTKIERSATYNTLVNKHLSPKLVEELSQMIEKGGAIGSPQYLSEIQEIYKIQVVPKTRGGDRKSERYKNNIKQLNTIS